MKKRSIFTVFISLLLSLSLGLPSISCGQEQWTLTEKEVMLSGTSDVRLEWSVDTAPNYYLTTGEAQLVDDLEPGEYVYPGFDDLGRTLGAKAKITGKDREMAKTQDRLVFDSDAKRGLPVFKDKTNRMVSLFLPDGEVVYDYFWNRSHLIADSLGGAPRRYNLITGTRMQNVGDGDGGMTHTELKAKSYLDSHPKGWILYSAIPVYQDKEPIPRVVVVDMVSNDGSINERDVIYNTSLGYSIDYQTGEFKETKQEKHKKKQDNSLVVGLSVALLFWTISDTKQKKKKRR